MGSPRDLVVTSGRAIHAHIANGRGFRRRFACAAARPAPCSVLAPKRRVPIRNPRAEPITAMTERTAPALRLLLAVTAIASAGCYVPYRYGPGSGPLSSRPAAARPAQLPSASIPGMNGGPAACQYALSQGNPLITEWPASEKANLEALLRGGA